MLASNGMINADYRDKVLDFGEAVGGETKIVLDKIFDFSMLEQLRRQ